MTFYTTAKGIKAPNDDERVSKGGEAMRSMADSINAALDLVSAGTFTAAGGGVDLRIKLNGGTVWVKAGRVTGTIGALGGVRFGFPGNSFPSAPWSIVVSNAAYVGCQASIEVRAVDANGVDCTAVGLNPASPVVTGNSVSAFFIAIGS